MACRTMINLENELIVGMYTEDDEQKDHCVFQLVEEQLAREGSQRDSAEESLGKVWFVNSRSSVDDSP